MKFLNVSVNENGYSMIEVLVSILLLSTAILGTVGLQAAAVRTTQQSAYQTAALQLASDIADAVHATALDPRRVEAYESVLDLDYTSSPGEAPAVGASCHFHACEPSEFAFSEVSEWKTRLATDFPMARIRICRDSDPWDEAGRALRWECSGGEGDAGLVVKIGWNAKNPDGSHAAGSTAFPPGVVLPVAPV